MAFRGKHTPEANAKRSVSMKAVYASGDCNPRMGWPKHKTEEDRRRSRLNSQLKHRYGISIDDYERMIIEQDNKCLICDSEEKLVVDHDHNIGHVRGLLCQRCNKALGFVDSVGLQPIAKYLDEALYPTREL